MYAVSVTMLVSAAEDVWIEIHKTKVFPECTLRSKWKPSLYMYLAMLAMLSCKRLFSAVRDSFSSSNLIRELDKAAVKGRNDSMSLGSPAWTTAGGHSLTLCTSLSTYLEASSPRALLCFVVGIHSSYIEEKRRHGLCT